MRESIGIPLVGLGIALAAGTSVARAQTVETVITPAPGAAIVEQAPLVPSSGVLLAPAPAVAVTTPVQTVETVRTVRTVEPRMRHVAHPRVVDRVTTTRTIVRQGVVAAPPAYAAAPTYAAAPAYDDLRRGPRLYNMVDDSGRRSGRSGRARDSSRCRAGDAANLSLCLRARSHLGDRPIHQRRRAGDPALSARVTASSSCAANVGCARPAYQEGEL